APGWGAITLTNGVLDDKPSSAQVAIVLDRFIEMVEAVANGQPLTLNKICITPSLLWLEPKGPCVLFQEVDDRASWLDRCAYPLAKMLSEDGPRLRRCPSKLAHDRHECLNFFIKAKRGIYCSRACTSRVMSRRFRDGKATPKLTAKKGARSHVAKK
ncbi:MAG: hypothetical protein ABI980_14845, partial [Nitrospirota bacterium]